MTGAEYDRLIAALSAALAEKEGVHSAVEDASLQLALNCLIAAKYKQTGDDIRVPQHTHRYGFNHFHARKWLEALNAWLGMPEHER